MVYEFSSLYLTFASATFPIGTSLATYRTFTDLLAHPATGHDKADTPFVRAFNRLKGEEEEELHIIVTL